MKCLSKNSAGTERVQSAERKNVKMIFVLHPTYSIQQQRQKCLCPAWRILDFQENRLKRSDYSTTDL